jgi:single-strand DNA-binding protein
MAGINKVILLGRLGKDPEIMTFDNGTKKATFSLATTESYRDKDGNWQEQTEWHNIVLWRYLAEKNLIKGDQIYLEGRIRSRSYDATDGTKRYITEIQGDKILKLASPSVSQSKGPIEEDNQAPPPEYEGSDDLPF